MTVKRYAQVGLGGRSLMYTAAILGPYRDTSALVGLCDLNPGRVALRQRWVEERGGGEVRGYAHTAFERMIAETHPDTVIVTTKDCTHDAYICRALELGCDVITEKPLTTDAAKCQRIIDTQRRTGKEIRVTFNYRYSPPRTQVKELLMSGVIGDVLSVDFHWMLDTYHGADYFRRWHRNKVNSGSLLVHKATHHFDLMNWWLSSVPGTVSAMGQRRFYTPKQAERYGLTRRTERCLDCPEAGCPFRLDLRSSPELAALYLANEAYDGYYRDRCVFSADIDIYDTMNVLVSYASGAKMSYSLNAFTPWEGYIVVFNGSKGRLEHKCEETVYINGDGSVPGEIKPEGTTIRVYPHFSSGYAVPVWQAEGGHGGGDTLLLEDIFAPERRPDRYLRAADQRAGAYSILTGVAASRSIASGQLVHIGDLVHDIGLPDYPPMPSPDEPIALAVRAQRVAAEDVGRVQAERDGV